MPSLFLVTLLSLFTAPPVLAGSCIAFDTNWNLLAFGFNGKDYSAGTSDAWASGTATEITASGRPPFDGKNTRCFLAEFFNAIYVVGGDASKASDIHIYNVAGKSWSTQAATTNNFDPTSFEAILDHDTNFFYALSKGELYALDMGELTAAKSDAVSWVDSGAAEITTTNYDPVMAVAQNHIFFFGVPGAPAGSAPIFVIHFAFWQPGAQAFGGDFPDSPGQAASFFLDTGVQQEIAFIPDDGSATYIVNVETNTTQKIAGPSTVDAGASYFASTTALVQLSASGALSWLPYSPSDTSANSAAKWSPVTALNSVIGSSSGSSGSSSGSSGSSASAGSSGSSKGSSPSKTAGSPAGGPSNSASGSNSGSAANPSGSSAATRSELVWGSGTVLGLVAMALSLL